MQEGKFNEESLIWKEGWADWVRAAEVEELNSLFQINTPPILSDNDTNNGIE